MAVHNATTCAYADVMTAYGLCVAGDTLGVPAGAATWSSNIVDTKGLNWLAAGIGATVITSNYNAVGGFDNFWESSGFLVTYQPATPADNSPFSFSGFSIDLGGKCHGFLLRNNSLSPISKVRIHHNDVYNPIVRVSDSHAGVGIMVYGTVYGVEDNNSWDDCYFRHYGMGNDAWTYQSFDFGTADAFYHEDSDYTIYHSSHFAYAECGTRYCFRHNTLDTSAQSYAAPFDAHGNQPGAISSTMGMEVYENTITSGSGSVLLDDLRGGKGLIYNNSVTTTSWVNPRAREEYNDSLGEGSANNAISGQPQHVSDSYFWGNKKNGSLLPFGDTYISQVVDYGGGIGLVPQWDVDCWRYTTPFTGASGVGSGMLAERPSSGLAVGVGYWATDTNTLYRATSATTWAAFYTPYTYPHPLRNQSPDPGEPAVLVLPANAFELTASAPTLVPTADYYLVVAAASVSLTVGLVTVTPIEATPWDIKLGPLGTEVTLPLLNWPAGSSPEMPEGTTAYIDSVALADGSVRHNFRTYSPRKWSFEWARLSEAQVTIFNELAAYNEPLHFQNKWVSADWHWVIVTACDPVPITATFTTGTPFWKLKLELEEII